MKRLYQPERTAGVMRWHAEDIQTDRDVTHLLDAKAWQHFSTTHPDFTQNIQFIYLF